MSRERVGRCEENHSFPETGLGLYDSKEYFSKIEFHEQP
jgi:hypothetical protein